MTISRTIRKRLRRYALFCLMAATTAGLVETSPSSRAGDTHDSGDLCGWIEDLSKTTFGKEAVQARQNTPDKNPPPCLLVVAENELQIDTCNYDASLTETQQTELYNKGDDDRTDIAAARKSRTSSHFNSTLATIAAAATAGNPIPFSQWTEPFAMIGPDGSHTPAEIEAFQTWFEKGTQVVREFVPVVDFSGEIAGPPVSSPAAVEHQPAVVMSDEPAIENPLVGSSAIIATIEEPYLPYDLAERDLDHQPEDQQVVWANGLLSPSHQPFCIRSLAVMREPGWSPLAKSALPVVASGQELSPQKLEPKPASPKPAVTDIAATDAAVTDAAVTGAAVTEIAATGTAPAGTAATSIVATQLGEVFAVEVETPKVSPAIVVADPEIVGSADCLLDEMLWKVSVALEEERVTDQWLRPDRIGTRMASLVVSGDSLATRVASELALVWPADAKPAKPIPGTGAKLLARAEAAEQLPAEGLAKPFTPEQLARADAKLWQWVAVTQNVIDGLSDRLTDVTEVARNRGTQDDSKKR